MLGLGKHAGFILAAYAAVFVTLAGLIAWLLWDGKRHERRLAELEAQGLGRGSRFTKTQDTAKDGAP
jgi:heme exporter protein D